MADTELKSNLDDFASGDQFNALEAYLKSFIMRTVSTSIPVVVTSVERVGPGAGAGYVSCKPLLKSLNNDGEGLEVTEFPRIPYFRLQHGTGGIVCDPVVGDIGLAVCAKADCSNINGDNTPKVPATYRTFNPSDSFYIGGFWGNALDTYVHVDAETGTIHIETPQEVSIKTSKAVIDCDSLDVTANGQITMTAAGIALNAPITGGAGTGANFDGAVNASGDVVAGTVSLQGHTHSGVQGGSSNTGTPNA